ncbi:hypothetical protein DYB28_000268 [Aphanomyces astaci]|uniref:Uncharacterized protein n=1 Tax=Aphanomyces astaci TaxID=112090 RepID=A0A397CBU2_APHAT|nr:hypothetical protein DYB36_011268 [Aphanomyces astaci]RHY27820.1 hypothetical protein DYB25_008239 [Aphanomyces astaci]RHY42266.1 hypothetical protein DYB34_010317 [Aphanomyces astaci]RHY43420.1 hypothetical protein DYB38_005218 [Aphanomyces astaci]RHY56631.1 hypothetical protein DYB30_001741 [Aphanomyces astaci]
MQQRQAAAAAATTRLNKKSHLDRPLGRGKTEVSESAFSFLFCEFVQYFQGRVLNISDLERKLEAAGYGVGVRVLELLSYRDMNGNVSKYVSAFLHMIHENAPLTNKYISVPTDMGQLNCAAYTAGVIRGILDSGGFVRLVARSTSHLT